MGVHAIDISRNRNVTKAIFHYSAGMSTMNGRLSEHLDAFIGFVKKRVGDPDVAADIVQDCIVKALAKADQLEDDALLVPWFYRILRNAITDVRRLKLNPDQPQFGMDMSEIAALSSETKAICQCVLGLLENLPTDQASALRLVDLKSIPPDEAASLLGISTNLLKVRRHRGRKTLRSLLNTICHGCADHECLDCYCPEQKPH